MAPPPRARFGCRWRERTDGGESVDKARAQRAARHRAGPRAFQFTRSNARSAPDPRTPSACPDGRRAGNPRSRWRAPSPLRRDLFETARPTSSPPPVSQLPAPAPRPVRHDRRRVPRVVGVPHVMAYWFTSSRLAPRSGGAARRGGPACSPAAARYSLKPRWSSPLQHLVTLDRPQPREVLAHPVRPFAVHQTPPRQELRDVVARFQTAVRRWPGQQGGRRPPDGRQVARAFSNPTPHGACTTNAGRAGRAPSKTTKSRGC